jgi:hypothetical protein
MAQCRHAHHGQSRTSDVWTKLAIAGEGVPSYLSDAFWLGGLFDLLVQADDAGFGLSWYGLSFGLILSVATAAGSVYSHTALNITHQDDRTEHHHSHYEKGDEHDDESSDEEEHNHDHDHEHKHDHDHVHVDIPLHEGSELINEEPHHTDAGLTWLQIAALAGDWVSHTGDIAGPIVMLAEIASLASKQQLPLWGKFLVQGSVTLFGAVSSVANVRTCKNSMLELNQRKSFSPV